MPNFLFRAGFLVFLTASLFFWRDGRELRAEVARMSEAISRIVFRRLPSGGLVKDVMDSGSILVIKTHGEYVICGRTHVGR